MVEAMGVSRGGAGELREQERGWTAVGEGLSTLKASIPDQCALGLRAGSSPQLAVELRRD